MGRFVSVFGVSREVVRVNFRGRNGLWSVCYRVGGGVEVGWFAGCQFSDVALLEVSCVRQGC